MGIFDRFRKNNIVSLAKYQMITEQGSRFYSWNGNLYQSDIIRACVRPKARAMGKAVAKHIRRSVDGLLVNPEPYIRFLLEEPNPYMTGQMLQEKLGVQLELNNNAWAYVERDPNEYPVAIYPITATSCEALQNSQGTLFVKFQLKTGKSFTFLYTDLIHLRKDFNDNDIFGDSPAQALTSLMEIVSTTDQGIVSAVKNSGVIRWLLKFNTATRPEDLKRQAKEFASSFMSTDSTTGGVAAVDNKADAQQIESKDYIPNALQMDKTTQRILAFFNTNEKIIQSSYSENEWISYYEACVEPDIVQLSNEFTRKLFNRKERGFGNKIVFESSNLSFASMGTKLALVQFVDRGIMAPNEVRDILGYAPVPGGDEMVRRLDTRPTTE